MQVRIEGVFTWPSAERRSDRYGVVTVDRQGCQVLLDVAVSCDVAALRLMAGRRVRVTAHVVEVRTSGHIGDIFRELFPTTPAVGEEHLLGEGVLFLEELEWSPIGVGLGLLPEDGRSTDWFDPRLLYRLHDQTVLLLVEDV